MIMDRHFFCFLKTIEPSRLYWNDKVFRTLLRVDQRKDKKGRLARLQPAGSGPGGIAIQRLRRICLPSAQFKVKNAAAQYFCLTQKYFWVIYAFMHMDTIKWNRSLIRMKRLCVNNNTEVYNPVQHLQKEISIWKAGVVTVDRYFDWCPCIGRLLSSYLLGCGEFILTVHHSPTIKKVHLRFCSQQSGRRTSGSKAKLAYREHHLIHRWRWVESEQLKVWVVKREKELSKLVSGRLKTKLHFFRYCGHDPRVLSWWDTRCMSRSGSLHFRVHLNTEAAISNLEDFHQTEEM